MNLKQVFTAITCGLCMSMANASLTYTTSVDHKDVKYHIDQCSSSGGKFSVSGWYLSGSDSLPGDIKIFLDDNGSLKEVPIARRERPDVAKEFSLNNSSKAGFSGSVETSSSINSFSHNIQIIDTSGSQEVKLNYSCNSTKDNVF